MLWRKARGLALCRQDCSKRRISRSRLNTTAFRSRYLDRLMRITATNQISTTWPSKPNIGRQRTSWVMSRGPKARNALQTKLDRLYPRQDAPTQLALDYSSEEVDL